jgi:hypothetical protein
MKPANVLLERAAPGDRHGEKQRIEPWIVEPFADVASSGNDPEPSKRRLCRRRTENRHSPSGSRHPQAPSASHTLPKIANPFPINLIQTIRTLNLPIPMQS